MFFDLLYQNNCHSYQCSDEMPEWIRTGDRNMTSNHWKSFSSLLSCWTSKEGNWTYKPQVPPLISKVYSNNKALSTKVYSSCTHFKNRKEALQYVWEPPSTCPAIPLFSRQGFCEVMRGRVLFIIGDSMSLHTYETLVNALGSRTQYGKGICFLGNSSSICISQQAYTYCSNFNLPNFQVVSINLPLITDFQFAKQQLLSHQGMANGSVVVANWGGHYVNDDTMKKHMVSVMNWFDLEMPNSLFIYRSPNMIHLDCKNYTLPDNIMHKPANFPGHPDWHHREFPRQRWYWKKYLKEYNQLGRVYLDVFPLSSKRPGSQCVLLNILPVPLVILIICPHITQTESDQHPGGNDCLHYCIPGPIDTWVILIYAVLSEIERRSVVISSDVMTPQALLAANSSTTNTTTITSTSSSSSSSSVHL